MAFSQISTFKHSNIEPVNNKHEKRVHKQYIWGVATTRETKNFNGVVLEEKLEEGTNYCNGVGEVYAEGSLWSCQYFAMSRPLSRLICGARCWIHRASFTFLLYQLSSESKCFAVQSMLLVHV